MPKDLTREARNTIHAVKQVPGVERVVTENAQQFLCELNAAFGSRIAALMNARKIRQHAYDQGQLPEYLPETRDIRQSDWQIAALPKILQDRRVEITGPVDRKMMINALNSGAKVFMADFEDASAPRFDLMVAGQINMMDYRDGCLGFEDKARGKTYELAQDHALMMIRPRGLHLLEENMQIDGAPIPAALFDFGLHLFHNGAALHEAGRGPFYYLPKLENHREARLWNEIFNWSQDRIGLPRGTIKATVLIETLRAAFEMDEIIWELRDHIAGLNCGRWDYIFSYIKATRAHSEYVLPDRGAVTMDDAFLATYAARLVKVCHRRGIHAMGGMAAQIPIKGDEAANQRAFDKVRADKLREVTMGHDGTWVAHPDLIPVAQEVFDAHMPMPNQIRVPRQYYKIQEHELLTPHKGAITEDGVRANISVALEYLAQWLNGRGAVPINNLMEDAATAEISRAQLWQWREHGAHVQMPKGDARVFDAAWFSDLMQAEIAAVRLRLGADEYRKSTYGEAMRLLVQAVLAAEMPDFITLPAYQSLNRS